MNRCLVFCLFLGYVVAPATGRAQEKSAWPKPDPGPIAVATATFDWKDAKRDRTVPVKLYYPKEMKQAAPVLVFSHGTGGSRETYAYLGTFWASHGYVSIHPQHAGSDTAAFIGKGNLLDAMKKAVANPQNAIERPRDVTFVLDQLAKLNRDDVVFKGKFNVEAVGVAGHSFGAHTALVSAGQALAKIEVKDKRIKAIIPMSAPAPKLNLDKAYAGVTVPSMHMTGTLDDSPLGDTKAKERRIPYDRITKGDKFLITFAGGDHMIFSGRAGKGDRTKDAEFQKAIKQASLAFWDAYLKKDADAAAWLTGEGLNDYLGKLASFESKIQR